MMKIFVYWGFIEKWGGEVKSIDKVEDHSNIQPQLQIGSL